MHPGFNDVSPATSSAPEAPTATAEPGPAPSEPVPLAEPVSPLVLVSEPPEDGVPTEKTPTLKERVRDFRARHEKWELALFFFAGFAYDILTLPRIDSRFLLTKQGVYLGVLGLLLLVELRWSGGVEPPRWLARVWRFREGALHFFLGGLLSPFSLFYF